MKITIADVRNNTYLTNCKVCGVEMNKYTIKTNGANFYEKKFCSTACWNSLVKKKSNVEDSCLQCGKKFTHVRRSKKRIYCSVVCSNEDKDRVRRSGLVQKYYYPFAPSVKYNRYPKRRMFV